MSSTAQDGAHFWSVPAWAAEAFRAHAVQFERACRDGTLCPADYPYDRHLAARIAAAFHDASEALVVVPDDDPSCAEDLRLVARGKLGVGDLFVPHAVSRRAPSNLRQLSRTARWLCAAFELEICDNEFGARWLAVDVERDPREVEWLVAGAVWVHVFSGVETWVWLDRWLRELERQVPDLPAVLASPSAFATEHGARMAEIGAAVRAGASFPEMSQQDPRWSAFPRP